MFRKRSRKKVLFLLVMDCDKRVWNMPEFTLWSNFDEALDNALEAVTKAQLAEKEVDITSMEIEEGVNAFLAECFEIMPISISSSNHITWLGKEREREKI